MYVFVSSPFKFLLGYILFFLILRFFFWHFVEMNLRVWVYFIFFAMRVKIVLLHDAYLLLMLAFFFYDAYLLYANRVI
jgi:hypothetical protein